MAEFAVDSAVSKADIARAASVFIPEIAALGSKTWTGGAEETLGNMFRNGTNYDGLALTIDAGNLLRALGMALTDPSGLAAFMLGANAYAEDVWSYATADGHPSYEDAVDLINTVGNLYGLTYSSYSVEVAQDARANSDHAQATLDTIFFLGGLVPGVSSGKKGVDYLGQVARAVAPSVASALTPGILSDDEITAIKENGEQVGRSALNASFTQSFVEQVDQLSDPYTVRNQDGSTKVASAQDFADNITTEYDSAVAEYGNEHTTGTTQVALNDGGTRDRGQMP